MGWIFFVISLSRLAILMIFTGERSLVVLSMQLPLGSPLEYPNIVSELSVTRMYAPLGLWFGSEAAMCMCYCRRLMNWHEVTFWWVGIYCVPNSGSFLTYKINSEGYSQLMDFITLSISSTWLIPTFGGRRRASELASTGTIIFTLGTDEG